METSSVGGSHTASSRSKKLTLSSRTVLQSEETNEKSRERSQSVEFVVKPFTSAYIFFVSFTACDDSYSQNAELK